MQTDKSLSICDGSKESFREEILFSIYSPVYKSFSMKEELS
jgi:hypothetical protein